MTLFKCNEISENCYGLHTRSLKNRWNAVENDILLFSEMKFHSVK